MATSLPPSSAFLDADISYKALGGAIAFIVIDTSIVALRTYTRCITKSPLGWDDFLIVPAFIAAIGLCINVIRERFHFSWPSTDGELVLIEL